MTTPITSLPPGSVLLLADGSAMHAAGPVRFAARLVDDAAVAGFGARPVPPALAAAGVASVLVGAADGQMRVWAPVAGVGLLDGPVAFVVGAVESAESAEPAALIVPTAPADEGVVMVEPVEPAEPTEPARPAEPAEPLPTITVDPPTPVAEGPARPAAKSRPRPKKGPPKGPA